MFQNKKVLIGITGSIAAYKTILLVRLLVKAGAEVKVVATPAAKAFVPFLTLSTLSRNEVLSSLADDDSWANHVMLGRWADVFIIAPATCNTIAKMASGLCDNLLLAVYLSATCPVVIAPAMDEDMWHHPATVLNIKQLQTFGNRVLSVGSGELGSGLFGEGRMAEPDEILTCLETTIFRGNLLANRKVLISAGPTYEAIDPVRFIGNHSSGKMGFALAERFFQAGADVHVVCGPVNITTKYKNIVVTRVTTAREMFDACTVNFPGADICVMSAAVADYCVAEPAPEKIKKSDEHLVLELVRNPDILLALGRQKSSHQVLAGFALETNNERENALSKLKKKNADIIILNSLRDSEAGFGKDTNKVSIFDSSGNEHHFETKSKANVADDIVNILIKMLHDKA